MITCRGCGRAQAKALCDACRSARYRGQGDERRLWLPIVMLGATVCARAGQVDDCPGVIDPGDDWDLDHVDGFRLPAHARCNRIAGALSL